MEKIVLCNRFYSGICIRTEQFNSNLIRSQTESKVKNQYFYPTQSDFERKISIRLNSDKD